MKFHSYTARLALLYALLFSLSALLLFSFLYFFTAARMLEQTESTIQAEIRGLAEQYELRGLGGLIALIKERVSRQRAHAGGNAIYLLAGRNLRPLAGNLDRWPGSAESADGWVEFNLRAARGGETHLVRARVFRLRQGRYALLVGLDIHQLTTAKRRIVQALGWGLAVMLLLAFPGGLILGRRSARKIERINQTARSIMRGDLSRRVPLSGDNDDFDQVAQNLNQMLDRIRELMEDIRRVSDGIAHDLRTPLTRLRQHLEEARRAQTADAQSARATQLAIAEADALLSTFNALLRIARIESAQSKAGFAKIDLRKMIEDAAEFYRPLCEQKQQRIETKLEPGLHVQGDRDLLFQALANIIENSAKHAPHAGVIQITLRKEESRARIDIRDNGPGIPPDEREKVFRRFYRIDRSRSTKGNGLGLSLVAAVIALHDGSVELRDNHPGLHTLIRLPLNAGG